MEGRTSPNVEKKREVGSPFIVIASAVTNKESNRPYEEDRREDALPVEEVRR